MPNSCPRARVWCSQHKLHLNSRPFISVVKRMHSSKVRQRAPWTGNGPSPSSRGFSGNPVWGMVRAEVVRSKRFEAGGGPKKPQPSPLHSQEEKRASWFLLLLYDFCSACSSFTKRWRFNQHLEVHQCLETLIFLLKSHIFLCSLS